MPRLGPDHRILLPQPIQIISRVVLPTMLRCVVESEALANVAVNLAPTTITSLEITSTMSIHGPSRKLSTTSLWIFGLVESSTTSILLSDLFSRLESRPLVYEPSSAVRIPADQVTMSLLSVLQLHIACVHLDSRIPRIFRCLRISSSAAPSLATCIIYLSQPLTFSKFDD